MADEASPLFREEALDHYRTYRAEGAVVRIAPGWTRWTYWLVVWAVLAGLLFSCVGSINEYATGAAVVRIDGRTELTTPTPATVAAVFVRPGQRVRAGDTLVRFYLAQEEAELARVEKEYDGLLARMLINPADQVARGGLNALRAQRELARARLAQRAILAPHDGVVADVRVRPGQSLAAGDPLIAMTTAETKGRVVALVPAQFRPMLRAGMPVRLELTGFRFAYQELHVEVVGDEAVGANEVRRFLGPQSGDTVSVQGPVVLVEASLPAMTFRARGEDFQYYDGMLGTADVRVRQDRIFAALIPGLRDLLRRYL